MISNTASVHQKHPPARTAVCLPFVGFISRAGSGKSAAAIALPSAANAHRRAGNQREVLSFVMLLYYHPARDQRNASVGSIDAARRLGIRHAIIETTKSTRIAPK